MPIENIEEDGSDAQRPNECVHISRRQAVGRISAVVFGITAAHQAVAKPGDMPNAMHMPKIRRSTAKSDRIAEALSPKVDHRMQQIVEEVPDLIGQLESTVQQLEVILTALPDRSPEPRDVIDRILTQRIMGNVDIKDDLELLLLEQQRVHAHDGEILRMVERAMELKEQRDRLRKKIDALLREFRQLKRQPKEKREAPRFPPANPAPRQAPKKPPPSTDTIQLAASELGIPNGFA